MKEEEKDEVVLAQRETYREVEMEVLNARKRRAEEVRLYRYTYIYTYMHTYILTYILTYIHAYIHTYIHTYIHI